MVVSFVGTMYSLTTLCPSSGSYSLLIRIDPLARLMSSNVPRILCSSSERG